MKESYQSNLDEDDLENDFQSIANNKSIFPSSSATRRLDYQPLQIDGKNHSSSGDSSIGQPDSWSEQLKKKIRNGKVVYAVLVLPLIVIIIILSIIVATPKHLNTPIETSTDTPQTNPWEQFHVTSTKGAVATDIQICSQIGVNILMQGGNAVDAAIAAKLCLSVVSPASSGVGGGCYMLIHNATEKDQYFIDAREVAPSLATPTMFQNDPMKAQDGGLAIAVLGEMKGLYLAYQKFGSGKVSWSNLVLPAAILAKEWIITPQIHKLLYFVEKQLFSGQYPLLSALYLKKDANGKLVMKEAGDIVQQPELSNTLEMIGKYGPDYLYSTMAETLANEIQAAGGIITKEDIMKYEPILTKPIKANFHGYQYIGVGGSSSGGPIVIAILKYMSSITQPLVSLNKNLYFHYLVECMKHVFAIRTNLGDPDYVNVTNIYSALQSDDYMTYLQSELTNEDHTLPLLNYGGKYNLEYLSKEDHGTTHLSVIDHQGNAIGMTSTINTYFGSKVISPSTGILFNNQMDDFAIPNAPNYFGLAPSPYNYPEPGKKPLSSMSPSIVLDHRSNVRLVGGGSGGPKIITATAQVILNFIELGMSLLDAVRSPRVHSQLLPDSVDVENATLVSGLHISMPVSIVNALTARGHHNASLVNVGMGVTQFISFDPEIGLIEAVSDPRKDGKPAALK